MMHEARRGLARDARPFVPFTTNLRWSRFPFCVVVQAGDGGLAAESVALCHQIRVSDKSRLRQCLGQVSEATIAKVARAIHITLAA